MSDAESGLRERLVAAARQLSAAGMNPGRSGNLSARLDDGFVVTPSALAYEALTPADVVFVDSAGRSSGTREPSSEWRLHRDLYMSRPSVGAVVHTHSPHATTLACLRRDIPAFHYEVAFAGGNDIRCGAYATFGTQELSYACLAAMEGRDACLLANHGAVAVGVSIEAAGELAQKVESLARVYLQALQVGEPSLIDGAEMARVLALFASYGKPR